MDEDQGGPPADLLARVQSITDVSLTRLGLEDLLVEILDRTMEALDGDTAAVLLVDPAGKELVATAARGLEEEVRQGVRVPIGIGFAGRVASERRPLIIDEIGPATVWNPILWEKQIQSILGVPLLVGADLVGVLHVGTLGDRRFGQSDVEVLELVADRIALAARMALLEQEATAAGVLQRSLLPTTPERLGELEFASRYVAAGMGGVGGDWYDVFGLDDGTTWIVIGDVAGHGFAAAVLMSRVRSALRAYALTGASPAEVLELTDHVFLHYEATQMATIGIVAVSADFDRATMVLAGHLPPVVVGPGQPASFIDLQPGLPVGVQISDRPMATIDLAIGDSVVLYTDGLIERRGESISEGLERLRTAVIDAPPSQICAKVMAALVGTWTTEDDIAILAARRAGPLVA